MSVYRARNELRKIGRANLFKLASRQRISRCVVSGETCGFYLHYKGFGFCLSEILGQGCQIERMEKLEDRDGTLLETDDRLPFTKKFDTVSLQEEKRNIGFRVYYRDCVTRSFILLGKVIERRTKERGNNLKDLLVKAVSHYSSCVADPSAIFLVDL